MGVERLLELMRETGDHTAAPPDVYLVRQGERATAYAERLAEQLRDAGLSVVLHCGGGSFKSQMKKADASGARYAVVIGDDEADAEALTLKPLRNTQAQARLNLAEALERVRAGQ
jgi:histidyl-tRNA synthetase